jgi:hypothetical protein
MNRAPQLQISTSEVEVSLTGKSMLQTLQGESVSPQRNVCSHATYGHPFFAF